MNPISYAWDKLKWSAKKRKISFTLTREQFYLFCLSTNYVDLKGKTAGSLSVDRKDPSKGYSYDNIEAMTLSDNSRKAHVDRKIAAIQDKKRALHYAPEEYPF